MRKYQELAKTEGEASSPASTARATSVSVISKRWRMTPIPGWSGAENAIYRTMISPGAGSAGGGAAGSAATGGALFAAAAVWFSSNSASGTQANCVCSGLSSGINGAVSLTRYAVNSSPSLTVRVHSTGPRFKTARNPSPTSSAASRLAASSGVSPSSTAPPGMHHSPGWSPSPERSSSSTSSSGVTKTMPAAAFIGMILAAAAQLSRPTGCWLTGCARQNTGARFYTGGSASHSRPRSRGAGGRASTSAGRAGSPSGRRLNLLAVDPYPGDPIGAIDLAEGGKAQPAIARIGVVVVLGARQDIDRDPRRECLAVEPDLGPDPAVAGAADADRREAGTHSADQSQKDRLDVPAELDGLERHRIGEERGIDRAVLIGRFGVDLGLHHLENRILQIATAKDDNRIVADQKIRRLEPGADPRPVAVNPDRHLEAIQGRHRSHPRDKAQPPALLAGRKPQFGERKEFGKILVGVAERIGGWGALGFGGRARPGFGGAVLPPGFERLAEDMPKLVREDVLRLLDHRPVVARQLEGAALQGFRLGAKPEEVEADHAGPILIRERAVGLSRFVDPHPAQRRLRVEPGQALDERRDRPAVDRVGLPEIVLDPHYQTVPVNLCPLVAALTLTVTPAASAGRVKLAPLPRTEVVPLPVASVEPGVPTIST